MAHGEIIQAQVKISDDLEAVILKSNSQSEEYQLLKMIRTLLPSCPGVGRSIEGIRVDGQYSQFLLQANDTVSLGWHIDARRFAENRARLCDSYFAVKQTVSELKDGGAGFAKRLVGDSDGLDILDDHQIVNIAAMTLPNGFGLCLFDEQGAGKTVTTIFGYDLLVQRKYASRLLIVAPKSMLPEWEKDFTRFRPGLYVVKVIAGTGRAKRNTLRERADVYVTNFESVVSMEPNFRSLLRGRPDETVLVVDESFFIKSSDAKRTRALRRLREWCGRAFVLCGTPAPNSPHDLVQQFSLVDFGTTFADVHLPDDRESAAPLVRKAINNRGIYVRHLKSKVLPGLPLRRFQRLYVPLRPEQEVLYGRLRDELVLDLNSVSDSQFRRSYSSFLARRTALLQICSNPGAVMQDYSEIPAKVLLLDDLLRRLINDDNEKVIVWSFYTSTIDLLVGRYSELGVVRYDGKVTETSARSEAVRRFQEDESIRLFVGNPAAAGAGLTLHRARVAIYESMSSQAAHYLQSLDRIHRRGQTRDVEYVVILCEDTLEITEYERLLRKQRMAGDLLGDKVTDPITRESFLRDLDADSCNPIAAQS